MQCLKCYYDVCSQVQVARNELKVLHDEKHKTERVKATVQREVDTARAKTSKLEEVGGI